MPDHGLREQQSNFFFFFNDTATTEIYPLPLHDALPISIAVTGAWSVFSTFWGASAGASRSFAARLRRKRSRAGLDRKSTRLNSSHVRISYAVFCLKKKKLSHLSSSNASVFYRIVTYLRE